MSDTICTSLRSPFVSETHWPKVAHHCSDPWCPKKVCAVCGKQARECVESQRDPKAAWAAPADGKDGTR